LDLSGRWSSTYGAVLGLMYVFLRFPFLFITIFTPCRFLFHAKFATCSACSQASSSSIGCSVSENDSCPWQTNTMLPKTSNRNSETYATKFQVKRHKGPDIVDRYWLNGKPWLQLSPRVFVFTFITLIGILLASGLIQDIYGHFNTQSLEVNVMIAFYVFLAFILASTGHSTPEDHPEMMLAPLRIGFGNFEAAIASMLTAVAFHISLNFQFIRSLGILAVPPTATFMALVLIAGLSKEEKSAGEVSEAESKVGEDLEKGDVDGESLPKPTTAVDSTLVYSSERIRSLDLRVLVTGLSVTCADIFLNSESGVWPVSATVSGSTTVIMLIIDNSVPLGRDLEPLILYFATVSLVAIFSHFNFLNLFGFFHDNELPDESGDLRPVLLALWFALPGMMIVNNRRLIHARAETEIPTQAEKPAVKNQLLVDIDLRKLRIDCRWQLRNAQVSVVIFLSAMSTACGELWMLPSSTTIVGLGIFLCAVGLQIRPIRDPDDLISTMHLVSLGLCVLATMGAGVMEYFDLIDRDTVWHKSSIIALLSYINFSIWLPRIGRLARYSVDMVREGRGLHTSHGTSPQTIELEGKEREERESASADSFNTGG